jgi:hypothetical protein
MLRVIQWIYTAENLVLTGTFLETQNGDSTNDDNDDDDSNNNNNNNFMARQP